MAADRPDRPLGDEDARIAALDAALHATDHFWLEINEMDHGYAEELAQRLSDDGWQALRAVWRARPPAWQCCLATVLGLVAPRLAIEWLLEIIVHGEDEVALHAIDELRSLQQARTIVSPWPASAIARVDALWSRHRGFTANQRAQFLADLAHGGVVGR